MAAAHRILTAALLVCAACSDDATATDVDRVVVAPAAATLAVGESVQLTATVTARDGSVVSEAVRWSSSADTVVRVSADGVATGVAPGGAAISAVAGARRAVANLTVVDGAVVGPAGGVVTALDGKVTIEVPAGAVAASGVLRVERATPTGVDPRLVLGTAVRLEGVTFVAPVTLRLAYTADAAPLGVPEDWLRLARRDGDDWVERAGAVEGGRVSAAIVEPGLYAVRVARDPASCATAEHAEFDFWVGSWDVIDGNGVVAARSFISKSAGGCLLLEDFVAGTYNGRSVNFRRADTGLWYQTYVDNAGEPPLRMSGGLAGGKMILVTAPGPRRTRFTWERLEGGRVRQIGEDSADGGATWTQTFVGTYVR